MSAKRASTPDIISALWDSGCHLIDQVNWSELTGMASKSPSISLVDACIVHTAEKYDLKIASFDQQLNKLAGKRALFKKL